MSYGLPGWTETLSPRADTLPIADEERDVVASRERERRRRGFGFAPTGDDPSGDPLLWEGDGA